MARQWPPTTPDSLAPANILDDGIIEIRAGAGMQQKSFMAYKNALRHYSMYFKGQLSGAWPEAEAGVLEFTDVEPEIMQRVVYFITTRQYERPASVDDQFGTISELWVLADWLGIPLLGNLMINELRDAVVDSWTAPVEQINYIYDNTAPGSSLRRAAVFYTCRILDNDLANRAELHGWVEEAAVDMLEEQIRRLEKDEPRPCPKAWLLMRYVCQFHEHDGEDCPEDPRHQGRLLALAEGDRAGRRA